MMQDIQKIRSVFCEALEKKTKQEREAYLTHVCGDDSRLRVEVDALLRMQPDADEFFKDSFVDIDVSKGDLTETPGTIIDRYKLLEKIGEGGMAVVYMAEQTEPIRRKVALKIIKLGMDTKSVIARFEAERQALAMMDHPNIAKVLDAGATETGRPYFVMELVTGVSITEYCDKNNLSTKERLALFIEICNAVQHAHQKGIIHRDIKPTNVMVTRQEGSPIPKVIDFGIAKAINQKLTEKTLFTRYAHIIGTPAYMSPEQADLGDLDIDTRSDIYSLGVLLYELLTGTTPFSEEELRKVGYLEMQRVIREQQPPKPSTKLSTLGETLTDIAKYRGSTPDLLTKAIRGDLDWIVMKALEKDCARRYEGASSFALDIERYLEHRPVEAHAPSAVYCLRKFLRRRRIEAVAVLVLSIMTSILVIALLVWGQNKRQLEMEVAIRHRMAIYRCQYACNSDDLATALLEIEPILNSKHVGDHAQIMLGRIRDMAQEKVNDFTDKIKDDPEDANNYFQRACYYTYLNDKEKVLADMDRYVTILDPFEGMSSRDRWSQFLRNLWRSTPTNLGSIINSAYGGGPCISADGLSLYFDSPRPGGYGGFDAWMTIRKTKEGQWANPVNLGPTVNNSSSDGGLDISADGLTLYFASNRSSGFGDYDLWVTTRATVSDSWGTPLNLGSTINSSSLDWCSNISADGLTLFIESNRPGGFGDTDIYMSTRPTTSDAWAEPVNLGSRINSSSGEGGLFLSVDGLLLFFDSDRSGGCGDWDLWVTMRATIHDDWGTPVNLGPTVNSSQFDRALSISVDGSTMFFMSNRPGGFANYDLWQVSINPKPESFQKEDDIDTVQKSPKSNDRKEVIPDNSK